jgi:N-acetylglucosamine-6-phosphate deacetylase
MAIAAKTPSRVMAISDATSVAGCPVGSRGRLGGREITAGPRGAQLADGTLAGSTVTMDGAFRTLVGAGISLPDAAILCSTTAARELGLVGHGVLAVDAVADLVVLDGDFAVVQTYVAGRLVYSRAASSAAPPQ